MIRGIIQSSLQIFKMIRCYSPVFDDTHTHTCTPKDGWIVQTPCLDFAAATWTVLAFVVRRTVIFLIHRRKEEERKWEWSLPASFSVVEDDNDGNDVDVKVEKKVKEEEEKVSELTAVEVRSRWVWLCWAFAVHLNSNERSKHFKTLTMMLEAKTVQPLTVSRKLTFSLLFACRWTVTIKEK